MSKWSNELYLFAQGQLIPIHKHTLKIENIRHGEHAIEQHGNE